MKELEGPFDSYYGKRPLMVSHDTPSKLSGLLLGEVEEVQAVLEAMTPCPEQVEELGQELADVVVYVMLIARHFDIDMTHAVLSKLAKNEDRFPEHLFNGSTPGSFEEIYLSRKRELGER